jgi:hypothetical protein
MWIWTIVIHYVWNIDHHLHVFVYSSLAPEFILGFFGEVCVAHLFNFCVVLSCINTFWIPYDEVRCGIRVKTMFGSSLLLVVCRMTHVLFTLCVFVWENHTTICVGYQGYTRHRRKTNKGKPHHNMCWIPRVYKTQEKEKQRKTTLSCVLYTLGVQHILWCGFPLFVFLQCFVYPWYPTHIMVWFSFVCLSPVSCIPLVSNTYCGVVFLCFSTPRVYKAQEKDKQRKTTP